MNRMDLSMSGDRKCQIAIIAADRAESGLMA